MKRRFAALALVPILLVAACATGGERADPASDAPEPGWPALVAYRGPASYDEALRSWRTPEEVNAWIGARFRYDMGRAMRLSETQRRAGGTLPIHPPDAFFTTPAGVCVDLSRFAVETLRQIAPETTPQYLMIEFSPVAVAGNTLRLHWVASFRRDGQWYFFADSKRPGHIAGPYATVQHYIDQYAEYRGRGIVAFRDLPGYERQKRAMAVKEPRALESTK